MVKKCIIAALIILVIINIGISHLYDNARFKFYSATYPNNQSTEWTKKLVVAKSLETQSLFLANKTFSKYKEPASFKDELTRHDHLKIISDIQHPYENLKIENYKEKISYTNAKSRYEALNQLKQTENKLLNEYQWLIEKSKNPADTEVLRKIQEETINRYELLNRIPN